MLITRRSWATLAMSLVQSFIFFFFAKQFIYAPLSCLPMYQLFFLSWVSFLQEKYGLYTYIPSIYFFAECAVLIEPVVDTELPRHKLSKRSRSGLTHKYSIFQYGALTLKINLVAVGNEQRILGTLISWSLQVLPLTSVTFLPPCYYTLQSRFPMEQPT